jgi:hypothetical protein
MLSLGFTARTHVHGILDFSWLDVLFMEVWICHLEALFCLQGISDYVFE